MTEYIQEVIKPFQKLEDDQKDALAAKIKGWNEDFNKKRQPQIDTALQIQKHLHLNREARNDKEKWKTNLKENKLYTTADTMKSIMWREIWSNENQMFDTAPMDKNAEETYKQQKAAVVKALKEMKASIQFDAATDYWMVWGDFLYLTDWKHKEKTVKRVKEKSKGLQDTSLPIYDNANLTAINPMFFVWDVTNYKIGDSDSWDSCIKIYKRFETLENIKKNKVYTLTAEQEEELKTTTDSEPPAKESEDNLRRKEKYGENYEVLMLHGDFTFDGVHYKNVMAEVIAGKYLIRFEENPIFINPFVWGATERDSDTLRGIAPLKCILNLVETKEEIINDVIDGEKLNLRPPVYVDRNSLEDKDIDIIYSPGKKVGLTPGYNGILPTPITFKTQGLFEAVGYINNATSDASSVNANTMGNSESGKKLATDLQLAQQGTNSRTALKLDKIYQVNIQVIKNIAELLAMFKTESENIIQIDKGVRTTIEITAAVRQANYDYIYEDRNALLDRRSKFQEIFSIFKEVAKDQELRSMVDWREVLTTGVEMTGFDNPDKFFIKENDATFQMTQELKKLPEEMQNQISMSVLQMIGSMYANNNNSINSQEASPA